MSNEGKLLVLMGPSGVGKSSVQNRLVERGWVRVVSSTTRPMRTGEANGVDYWFYNRDEFEDSQARGEFVETEDIYGNHYGLERRQIEALLEQGRDAVVVLGIGGARQVKRLFPRAIVVFIEPENREALMDRLAARGADTRRVETIDARHVDFPAHSVFNVTGKLDQTVAAVEQAVAREVASSPKFLRWAEQPAGAFYSELTALDWPQLYERMQQLVFDTMIPVQVWESKEGQEWQFGSGKQQGEGI